MGGRLDGRPSWRLLWASSRPLSIAVLAWAVLDIIDGPLVVVALGAVVGAVPGAIEHGMASSDGDLLIFALLVAALVYGFSLVLDPIGAALGTAARQRITGRLQARLLAAVSGPIGVAHLENTEVLDRLARRRGHLDRVLSR